MKEHDIRPKELLTRYVELSALDAGRCFSKSDRRDLPCVACGSALKTKQFDKNGFSYACCDQCGTLYQVPRPSLEAFEQFYSDSESSRYWAEVFFPAVAEVRREKIFQPRVKGVAKLCADVGLEINTIVDIGAGYGIFLEEWQKEHPESEAIAVEPSPSLAEECRNKGLRVLETIAEKAVGLDEVADLVVCFEVLEHVDDPLSFVENLSRMVRPGGYLFVSTLCIDGFDLQTLWEKSSQISPPHHINFLSINGFESLFNRAGLTDINVTTPGKLDVDIVRNASATDSSILEGQRFLKHVLSDEQASQAFQSYLSENRLSSHAWVLGKKP